MPDHCYKVQCETTEGCWFRPEVGVLITRTGPNWTIINSLWFHSGFQGNLCVISGTGRQSVQYLKVNLVWFAVNWMFWCGKNPTLCLHSLRNKSCKIKTACATWLSVYTGSVQARYEAEVTCVFGSTQSQTHTHTRCNDFTSKTEATEKMSYGCEVRALSVPSRENFTRVL